MSLSNAEDVKRRSDSSVASESTLTGKPWQQRLYEAYLSSGQATVPADTPEKAFAPRRAYLTHFVAKYFPADRTASILDIGCGHGKVLYFLSAAGYKNVKGVDLSQEQVDAAHRLGIPNVVCGSAFDYVAGLPDESLDVAILFDILEHLEKQDLFDMLDQVWRILRPGGRCIVHSPNGEGLFAMRILFGDLTHRQAFTRKSMEQLFATLGFAGIDCFEDRPIVHGPASLMRRIVWDAGTAPIRLLMKAETGNIRPILSQNLVAVAVKPRTVP